MEPLLAHWEALGIPVINSVAAWRFEKSKALQAELFERCGASYPRTLVINHRHQIAKVAERLRFPATRSGSSARRRRNATSNFVANAPEVLGFDPFPPFVDYIVRRAR